MNIVIKEAQSRVPVTIMQLQGELDASNYLEVIDHARQLHRAGTQHLLLDLSELSYMSSSGLMALHSMALIMSGDEPLDPEYGWSAFHAVARDVEDGAKANYKILNPQPSVQKTLDLTGFGTLLEIHTDLDTALASF